MANPPIEFLQDRAKLADWLKHNPTVGVDARHTHLKAPDFSGLDLNQADFSNATLDAPNFSDASLRNARLNGVVIRGGEWNGATIESVGLVEASLENVRLDSLTSMHLTHFDRAKLRHCSLKGLNLSGFKFGSAQIIDSDLSGTDLTKAVLTGVALTNCDLRESTLNAAELTDTTWYGTKIDAKTSFRGTIWRPQHDSANDGVDDLALPPYRRLLTWEVLRVLGRVPLFSGAYLLLTVALSVGSGIVLLNDWLGSSGLLAGNDSGIPFPDRLTTLLVGSAALAVGATIFEFACPSRVKEFSRTRWTEELRRPGMLYVSETLQRPTANGFALAFTLVGALLIGGLFVERLVQTLTIIARAT